MRKKRTGLLTWLKSQMICTKEVLGFWDALKIGLALAFVLTLIDFAHEIIKGFAPWISWLNVNTPLQHIVLYLILIFIFYILVIIGHNATKKERADRKKKKK